MVDAVCAAYFRTKRRHLNASESRTNGINRLLSVDGVASSEEYYWRLSTSVIGKFSRPGASLFDAQGCVSEVKLTILKHMEAKSAIILVSDENDKVYQVNINTDEVLQFLKQRYCNRDGVPIFGKPIEGMAIGKIVNAT